MTDRTYKSRIVVTEGSVYEQRIAGTVTEVRRTGFVEIGTQVHALNEPWLLLEPEQEEPFDGSRWTLRYAHGEHVFTDTVTEILGDLT